MPSRNVVRSFAENSIYHVYNRGVEKRTIFLDEQDYKLFLYYLFVYLNPLEKVLASYPRLPIRLQARNLHGEVELLAYCLMPNHFHLLLKQKSADGVSRLLKQLTNAYTLYFNQKYKRVGGLVQGRFKAVGVQNDNFLIHVARYIHLNPVVSGIVDEPSIYEWSSQKDYLENNTSLVNSGEVLSQFSSVGAYQKFVRDQIDYATQIEKIKHLTLEGDDI